MIILLDLSYLIETGLFFALNTSILLNKTEYVFLAINMIINNSLLKKLVLCNQIFKLFVNCNARNIIILLFIKIILSVFDMEWFMKNMYVNDNLRFILFNFMCILYVL